jgi:hypothetical protein
LRAGGAREGAAGIARLTLRARKADVGALAAGSLTAEAFVAQVAQLIE